MNKETILDKFGTIKINFPRNKSKQDVGNEQACVDSAIFYTCI